MIGEELTADNWQRKPKHVRIAAARRDAAQKAEADAAALALLSQPAQYLSFFRYASLPPDELERYRTAFLSELRSLGVQGRIYLASEGINAQMTCPVAKLEQLRDVVDRAADGAFSQVEFTLGEVYAPLAATAHNAATTQPAAPIPHAAPLPSLAFTTLQVRIRPRLVSDGLDAATHASLRLHDHGEALLPAQWHAELAALRSEVNPSQPSSTSALVIDCRNFYESHVGRFEGSIASDTQTYGQTFQKIDQLMAQQQQQAQAQAQTAAQSDATAASSSAPTAYLFCTGGIRCVKVGAYLRAKHPHMQVKWLKGGINAYANYAKEQQEKKSEKESKFVSAFKGRNFVFDSRSSTGCSSLRVTDDVLGSCAQCGTAYDDTHTNCRNARCHALFLQCPTCAQKMEHTCSEECKNIVRTIVKQAREIDAQKAAAEAAKEGQQNESYAFSASNNRSNRRGGKLSKPTHTQQPQRTAPSFANVPLKPQHEFRPKITWNGQKSQISTPNSANGSTNAFHSWSSAAGEGLRRRFSTAASHVQSSSVEPAVPSSAITGISSSSSSTAAIESYCTAHTTPAASSSLLANITTRTQQEMPDRANMLSGTLVGSLLRALVHAATAATASERAPRILELGTFTGYATAWLLDCLPSPPPHSSGRSNAGCVVTCELKADLAAIATDNLRAHPRFESLRIMEGPAIDSLKVLAEEFAEKAAAGGGEGGFDLVYIDANKKSSAAYVDFLLSAPGLLRPASGIIVLDNTLWKGRVTGDAAEHDSMTRAAHALNQKLRDDTRLIVTLLPIRDGITIVQQRPQQRPLSL